MSWNKVACGFHATLSPASFPFVLPPLSPHPHSLILAEFSVILLVGGEVALEIRAHIPQKRGQFRVSASLYLLSYTVNS
jgi:hypothetical protein